MMLEAGSSPRVRNKGGLTPLQLVDPRNEPLRRLIEQHDYRDQNAGDFIPAETNGHDAGVPSDDDADFSGSDEEERAEWERRRGEKRTA
ncbi:hypothetical protein E4U53_007458 [Claviceps sorghi]|nr:hypothetical protein E4U53_007458 [Claviceps sorghi]